MNIDPEPKTRRQREKVQRLEALIAASGRLFARHGFTDVSLDDIGSEVGITGQGIYRYFKSKQDLLAHLLIGVSEGLLAGGKAIRSETPVAQERLERLVDFHVDFALTNPEVIRVQGQDFERVGEAERRQVRRMQREYMDIWMSAVSALHPQETAAELRVRAQAVFGLINSTSHSLTSAAAPNLPVGDESVRELLSAMALSALATPKPM